MVPSESQQERREQDRRVTRLEEQVNRLTSDATSEKGTRARVNSDLLRQLDAAKADFKADLKILDGAWDMEFERVAKQWKEDFGAERVARSADTEKHDLRLKVLERHMYLGLGGLAVLQAVIMALIKIFL